MATYTSNYGLHQWAPEDNFLRTDFNEDLKKIDTALGGKAEQDTVDQLNTQVQGKISLKSGSYTGNGGTQTINTGTAPRAVYICYGYNILAYGCSNISIVSGGFMVSATGTTNANKQGTVYTYFAFY